MADSPKKRDGLTSSVVDLDSPFLSVSFKIWVVGILFFVIFLRLFTLLVFPATEVLSTEWILSLSLVLIGYLWTQELRDRYRLLNINSELVNAQRKLESAEIDTISTLIKMEEAKDPYVYGHSDRVSKFSVAIATAMDFSGSTLETIRRAALLHDMGKLVISDEVLLKPTTLSEEEWIVIRKHPRQAVDILEPLRFLHLEKKIILHHHERIDGGGYPAGLKGIEIPLESRIIAVADTFDAMNSARIYRDPCPREIISEELTRVAGHQLDEKVVKIFLRILGQNPEYWERS